MSSCARASIRSRHRPRTRTIFSTAWGLTPLSRLSCQAKVGEQNLVIEIPKYTINYAKEATK